MSHCLNPDCHKPEQHDLQARFCRCCGSQLRLRDRYRALRVIGQGGFGKTFLARDEVSGSPCVIKQFLLVGQSPQVTQKAIALFQEEAKRLEKLGHHSQIPEFYDYLEQNNRLYIVQEFIEGETLTEEVSNQGAFTEQKIRQLLGDLLPVLEFIHQGQVIHRDIKPDNIIRRKSDQKLVLVDFGAAKEVTQTALMKTGTIIGSAGYTAPEQAHGKAIFASDIFSLGVTCIYLLTRIEPSRLYDPLEGNFVWHHRAINPITEDFFNLISKMTNHLVKQRLQTINQILWELKSLPKINLKSNQSVKSTFIQNSKKSLAGKKTLLTLILASLGIFVGFKFLFSLSSINSFMTQKAVETTHQNKKTKDINTKKVSKSSLKKSMDESPQPVWSLQSENNKSKKSVITQQSSNLSSSNINKKTDLSKLGLLPSTKPTSRHQKVVVSKRNIVQLEALLGPSQPKKNNQRHQEMLHKKENSIALLSTHSEADQKILEEAINQASSQDYQVAINTASQIRSGRNLYPEARKKINHWKQEIQAQRHLQQANTLAESLTPEGLSNAIRLALQLPTTTDAGSQRTQVINTWSYQLLSIAQEKASMSQLSEAIHLARTIPKESSVYSTARELIKDWQRLLNPPAPVSTYSPLIPFSNETYDLQTSNPNEQIISAPPE